MVTRYMIVKPYRVSVLRIEVCDQVGPSSLVDVVLVLPL